MTTVAKVILRERVILIYAINVAFTTAIGLILGAYLTVKYKGAVFPDWVAILGIALSLFVAFVTMLAIIPFAKHNTRGAKLGFISETVTVSWIISFMTYFIAATTGAFGTLFLDKYLSLILR